MGTHCTVYLRFWLFLLRCCWRLFFILVFTVTIWLFWSFLNWGLISWKVSKAVFNIYIYILTETCPLMNWRFPFTFYCENYLSLRMTVWPRIDPLARPSQLQPADLWMKHKHFSMWNVYNAQCFQSNPELLPLISFKFRALRAFPAPHMFLNRTNANPRIFPSVIRTFLKN